MRGGDGMSVAIGNNGEVKAPDKNEKTGKKNKQR